MARIFITGSSDGLGQLAAQQLVKKGHQVILHARNSARAKDAKDAVPDAEDVVLADLSSIDETKYLASEINDLGRFDAIIHNAGVYDADSKTLTTVNTLAPYILTSLVNPPKRLIYLSSDLHKKGETKFKELEGDFEGINYGDTKLHVLLLSKAVARFWPKVQANAVDPGWVPTKMGGDSASDDLQKGYETQIWLATGNEEEHNGEYYFHKKIKDHHKDADDADLQDEFLRICEKMTGVEFPR